MGCDVLQLNPFLAYKCDESWVRRARSDEIIDTTRDQTNRGVSKVCFYKDTCETTRRRDRQVVLELSRGKEEERERWPSQVCRQDTHRVLGKRGS